MSFQGDTVLHVAVSHHDVNSDTISILIDYGFKPDEKDKKV